MKVMDMSPPAFPHRCKHAGFGAFFAAGAILNGPEAKENTSAVEIASFVNVFFTINFNDF
ncbi:hypothetical protein GCM10007276_20430 [Agaricicola taiwanensis]|uniref:Uncharacterized protein n=1 Tax=Agaricicola taiwanensis TaxID=591372 RepID=A0A8J2YHH9_9RHOB|nr:hypothetical protein GCM10007276_20430 [Agaricicola taiwanensis]